MTLPIPDTDDRVMRKAEWVLRTYLPGELARVNAQHGFLGGRALPPMKGFFSFDPSEFPQRAWDVTPAVALVPVWGEFRRSSGLPNQDAEQQYDVVLIWVVDQHSLQDGVRRGRAYVGSIVAMLERHMPDPIGVGCIWRAYSLDGLGSQDVVALEGDMHLLRFTRRLELTVRVARQYEPARAPSVVWPPAYVQDQIAVGPATIDQGGVLATLQPGIGAAVPFAVGPWEAHVAVADGSAVVLINQSIPGTAPVSVSTVGGVASFADAPAPGVYTLTVINSEGGAVGAYLFTVEPAP